MNSQTSALTTVNKGGFTPPVAKFIDGKSKDQDSRIGFYVDWLHRQDDLGLVPNLEDYRDYLLTDGRQRRVEQKGQEEWETYPALAKSTAAAHLSTIKAAYRKLATDNEFRNLLYAMQPEDASQLEKQAVVNEVIVRLRNAVESDVAKVKVTTKQDRTGSEFIRLNEAQAARFVLSPGTDTTKGLRDTAILSLMLSTGLREGELVALDVQDLRERTEDGELAVLVRHGKGDKQRLIPYGEMDWCLVLVDAWLDHAGIEEGPIFRGLYKPNEDGISKLRPGRMTTRSIIRVTKAYPVVMNGQARQVRPHDCRRTYARLMYDKGAPIEVIQANLGHASVTTTKAYIGKLDGKLRRTRALFSIELGDLNVKRRLQGEGTNV